MKRTNEKLAYQPIMRLKKVRDSDSCLLGWEWFDVIAVKPSYVVSGKGDMNVECAWLCMTVNGLQYLEDNEVERALFGIYREDGETYELQPTYEVAESSFSAPTPVKKKATKKKATKKKATKRKTARRRAS